MSCYYHFSAHFQLLLNQGVPMPVHIGAQIPFLVVTYAAIGKCAWQYFLTFILMFSDFEDMKYLLLRSILEVFVCSCHHFNYGAN